MSGNIGRAIIMKTSAVSSEHMNIECITVVFEEQNDLIKAFKK